MNLTDVQSALLKYVGGTIETDIFSSVDEPLSGEITGLKLEACGQVLQVRCCLVREILIDEFDSIQLVAPSSPIELTLQPALLDSFRQGREIWMELVMSRPGRDRRFVALSALKSSVDFGRLIPFNVYNH